MTATSTGQATALRGRVVLPDEIVEDGVVAFDDDTLSYVGPAGSWTGAAPRRVPLISPGLLDSHCHGGGGHSVTTGLLEDVRAVAMHHLAHGTTTMLASLVSADPDTIDAAVAAIRDVAREDGPIVGSHLEGPFLGVGHCGAHDPAVLLDPDPELTGRWLRTGDGTLRMMTLAPELPGAQAVMDLLVSQGAIAAVGHTDASAAAFAAALAGPADTVTHLFNGMAPMHHREPGPVAAGLAAVSAGTARVELIADGTHLADETVALVFALAPDDGVLLISDAMAAAGMPDGEYDLGPLRVDVRDAVAWTRGDKPSIAGSTAHLSDVVRRCIVSAGLDPVAVLRAATTNPAASLGLTDRGRLATGLRADLAVFDDQWHVVEVWRAGEQIR